MMFQPISPLQNQSVLTFIEINIFRIFPLQFILDRYYVECRIHNDSSKYGAQHTHERDENEWKRDGIHKYTYWVVACPHTHTDTKEFYSVYRCQITTGTADITFESCMKCLVLFHLAPLYPKCLVLCGVVRHCLLLRFRERANGIINIRELKTTLSSVNVMNIIVISYRILSSNVEYRISRSCVKSYATSKWK